MNKINGVVIGTVKSNKPDNLGRVEVEFPWLSDSNKTFWTRIATLMAGPGRGSWFMPETGDEVLVAFEHGDPQSPYIVGFLWNGQDRPPDTDHRRRLIRTVNGHEIEIYDPENVSGGENGYIRLKYANEHGEFKNLIELTNRGITISSNSAIRINAPSVVINDRPVSLAISPI